MMARYAYRVRAVLPSGNRLFSSTLLAGPRFPIGRAVPGAQFLRTRSRYIVLRLLRLTLESQAPCFRRRDPPPPRMPKYERVRPFDLDLYFYCGDKQDTHAVEMVSTCWILTRYTYRECTSSTAHRPQFTDSAPLPPIAALPDGGLLQRPPGCLQTSQ
ncbi:hypothetical protein OE88DRAFT_1656229 [Heliocybe sulcata]|uniref:Uncharacterized protein n=1 Tax=Heliocybe sulcata TaxID=5364 RepID=A0A5C3N9R0_9AGAM|nr:hypothetical protein OE88DRAFT_1656229 [Heliocybe sulcata]